MQQRDRSGDRAKSPFERGRERVICCRLPGRQVTRPQLSEHVLVDWVGSTAPGPVDRRVHKGDTLGARLLTRCVTLGGELALKLWCGDQIGRQAVARERLELLD